MADDTALPPRAEDLFRHLADLRSGTFEGAESWADRVRLFRTGITAADPVVRRVLTETADLFLDGTGTIAQRVDEDADGGVSAHWELSWPLQRERVGRDGGPVAPIQVIAFFTRGFTHPHLRGSRAGDWPFQVLTAADAERQEPIIRAIAEAELHQRIFDGTWRIVPRQE